MTAAGMVQRWRRWRLARLGLDLDRSCVVGPFVSVGRGLGGERHGSILVGQECELGAGLELSTWGGSIRIGRRVFLGPHVVIYGHGGVEIGDETMLAMHTRILSSEHTISARSGLIRNEPDILLPTKIGRDVWLGAGVTVLGGVTIGDGCVVGAGAVVTRDLPPYSIARGVPAKVVGERP